MQIGIGISIGAGGKVNVKPTNTVPAGQTVEAGRSLVFSSGNGNAIAVADADAASLTVTLAVSGGGALTLGGTTGLSFSAGDGTADTTMTFSGTPSAINTALSGLTFAATMASVAGSATLTLTTSDGVDQDVDTVAITINAFDPTALTGFAAWYDGGHLASLFQDAAGSTPVASLNDPVARWNARAGTGAPYWSTGTSSFRPLLKAVSGGTGNGLKFDGSDDSLDCSSATFFDFMHQTPGFTMHAGLAFNAADSASIQCLYDSTNQDNDNQGVTFDIRDDGANQGVIYAWVGNKAPTAGTPFFAGDPSNNSHGTDQLAVAFAFQAGSSGNDGRVWWNGTEKYSAESAAALSTGDSSFRTPRIGRGNNNARPLGATIRDLLFYQGRLSDADVALLKAWQLTR